MPKHRNASCRLPLHLIFIFTSSQLFFPSISSTHPDDLKALKDLKNAVEPRSLPAGSCLSSWNFSLDPCDNIFSDRFTCGLRCDLTVTGFLRVTEITLDPVGYSGVISSSSWNLPYLHTLDLSDNSFSGSIPGSLSNLTRLRRLGLSKNLLSGQIPDSLGSLTLLEELYLDNNRLQGSIPTDLNHLLSLNRLEIQKNRIFGEFPNLGGLKKLYFLDLSDNRISGEIPTRLPAYLVELSARNNRLVGEIPENLGKLGFLQVLDLSHNRLSGSVTSVLFQHQSLQQLTLSHNSFSSLQTPDDKNGGGAKSSKLIAVDLSFNLIGGLLPSFLPEMPELSALSLEHNRFTGMIPPEYALKAADGDGRVDNTSFERLLLGGNYLFGLIPGPLLGLKPGNADVSLADNCLYLCPDRFFFCQGRGQKPLMECKRFGRVIP